ncbi:transcription termination factor Rho [Verrucomicrobium sp. BvORR106]|uniref:transcription termination factor Rho n=1 Tax=Verrucomicrobium sp. BvORR106 TaxID=1403819 RepID=UPI000571DFC4|nr:transcription termination factor Rho [Verrucomicrobium sp. BvORR106]
MHSEENPVAVSADAPEGALVNETLIAEASAPETAISPATGASSAPENAGAPVEEKTPIPFPEVVTINELQASTLGALQAQAATLGWRVIGSRTKHQLVVELLSWMLQHGTRAEVEGFLEMQQESFGLIRFPLYNFAPLPEDIFVPIFVIRKFNLRPGQKIKATIKVPREKEKYLAMDRILEVEGKPVDDWQQPADFDKLTATFPSQRIILETPKNPAVSARMVDIIAPLGKGQRALICASPRSGKTMLLKDIARSITVNHPEVTLIILLLDERPEEVTDFEESVQTEIYSSTFDESPKRHSQVAELVLERAKRLVELGKDVVILLDSITRLARGYNALQGGKGRTMSGGIDAKALMKPKKFFGAARKVEEGGSLTIVATALVETESRMDEVIFEEFKGTGNMEVNLDREIAERRIFPAIHVLKSGTRRDELLYHPDEFKRISVIRKQLASVPAYEAVEFLLKNIERSKSNAELLLSGLR